eukprot:COSAG01_NODE_5390_length_4291_cov_3.107109_3_plen_237_part_00
MAAWHRCPCLSTFAVLCASGWGDACLPAWHVDISERAEAMELAGAEQQRAQRSELLAERRAAQLRTAEQHVANARAAAFHAEQVLRPPPPPPTAASRSPTTRIGLCVPPCCIALHDRRPAVYGWGERAMNKHGVMCRGGCLAIGPSTLQYSGGPALTQSSDLPIRASGGAATPTRAQSVAGPVVSGPFPSWNRSILTESYLCHACSCHGIEDRNGPDREECALCGEEASVEVSQNG